MAKRKVVKKKVSKPGRSWDDLSYLYIMGCAGGPFKIGYSYRPYGRLLAMIKDGVEGVYLVGQRQVVGRYAHAAERYAHWLLRDKHIGNEWFNVDRAEAEAAVEKALSPGAFDGYDSLNLIPRLPSMQAGTALPPALKAKIAACLSDGENLPAFLQSAVQNELARRAKAA